MCEKEIQSANPVAGLPLTRLTLRNRTASLLYKREPDGRRSIGWLATQFWWECERDWLAKKTYVEPFFIFLPKNDRWTDGRKDDPFCQLVYIISLQCWRAISLWARIRLRALVSGSARIPGSEAPLVAGAISTSLSRDVDSSQSDTPETS